MAGSNHSSTQSTLPELSQAGLNNGQDSSNAPLSSGEAALFALKLSSLETETTTDTSLLHDQTTTIADTSFAESQHTNLTDSTAAEYRGPDLTDSTAAEYRGPDLADSTASENPFAAALDKTNITNPGSEKFSNHPELSETQNPGLPAQPKLESHDIFSAQAKADAAETIALRLQLEQYKHDLLATIAQKQAEINNPAAFKESQKAARTQTTGGGSYYDTFFQTLTQGVMNASTRLGDMLSDPNNSGNWQSKFQETRDRQRENNSGNNPN
jgi:hypothetical protein